MRQSVRRKWGMLKAKRSGCRFVISDTVKRLFKIVTIASAMILTILIIMWPASYNLNLAKGLRTGKLAPSDSIPLIFGYRLGFENGGVWLYNYEMPWFGGTYSLTSGSNSSKPVVRYWHSGDYDLGYEADYDGKNKVVGVENDCDLPGIYFRQFWTLGKGPSYTTLMVSLCYPVLMSAVLPMLWILRERSAVLPIIKAPLAIQLFRCLFIVCLIYFGSLFWEYRHGNSLVGKLIIGSFPSCGLLGLIFSCVRLPWSRWVLALLGILIPGITLGTIYLGLPFQGWLDALCGLILWCLIVSVPITLALVLFKDKKTNAYFTTIEAS